MEHAIIDDGWYGDALPNGRQAILMPNGVLTDAGLLTPSVGWRPLYLCITDVRGFQIAGQADAASGTSWYHDGAWHEDLRIAHGNFGCIFDLQGELRIIEPAPDQTSQGYRYVSATAPVGEPVPGPGGRLWLGDETVLTNEVSKFTDLSDAQDRSLLVGQGHSYPGVVVFLEGRHHVLYKADRHDAVRAHRAGTLVSVYFYEILPGDVFRGHVFRATMDELRALPIVPTVPAIEAPVITVRAWGRTIEAGAPWRVEFDVSQTALVTVEKDANDRLQIGAVNDAGTGHTGAVRQLTVVCPETEPCPMPFTRFIFQPNIGTRDLFAMLDNLAPLAGQTASVYVQEILADASTPQLGPNIYPAFVAHDVFRRLKEAGVLLNVEIGSVKPGDCQAQNGIDGMRHAVQRVADAAGEVYSFSCDEPLTANQAPNGCHQSLEACADAQAAFIRAARALGPIKVVWLEAWPEIALADHETFLQLLDDRDALPDAWRADIDWDRAAREHKDTAAFIRAARTVAARHGVPFGLFVNSTKEPIATDAAHHANLVALAERIRGIAPDVHHLCVASWAHRALPDPTHTTQNVPDCLGPAGMLATFDAVRAMFDSTEPEPEPPSSGGANPMLYKLMEAVVRVKELKPSSAEGKVVAVTPDGRVGSVQPNGSFETRDPSTDAAYEQAYEAENLLLYEPIAGLRYAYAYRIVP